MRVDALRGVLGACCAVLGAGILVVPQAFGAAVPWLVQPRWGTVLLIGGAALLGIAIESQLWSLLSGARGGASSRAVRSAAVDTAMHALPLAVVLLDRQGRVTMWNPAAERLLGWGAREVLGRPLPFLLEDGGPRALNEARVAARPATKSGAVIDVTVSVSPLADSKGRAAGRMVLIEDAADHARTERLTRFRTGLLEILNAITAAVASSTEFSGLLERALDGTLAVLGVEWGYAWLDQTSVLRGLPPEAGTAVAQAARAAAERPSGSISVADCKALPEDAGTNGAGGVARFGIRALLAVPVSAPADGGGGVAVASARPRRWTPEETALIETVGHHLAGAIDSVRAYRAVKEHLQRESRAIAISKTLSHPAPLAEVVKTVGEAVLSLSGADRAAVYLRQPDGTVTCPWSHGLSERYVAHVLQFGKAIASGRLMDGTKPDLLELTGRGIDEPAPVLFPDLQDAPSGVVVPPLTKTEGYRALANWPLTRDGDALGLVTCYFDAPRTWTEEEQTLFHAFCQDAAEAIHQGHLHDERAARAADLEVLFDLSKRLRVARSPEEIYPILVGHGMDLLHAEKGVLNLLDPRLQAFDCVYAAGLPAEVRDQPFPTSGSAFGRVVETGTTYRTYNFGGEPLPIWMNGYRSIGPAVIVPVRSESEIIGTLGLGRKRGSDAHPFADAEVRLLEGIAEIGGTAIRRARLFQNLEKSYMQMVLSLARTMDARDHYTSGHSERIAVWAEAIARALECEDAETQEIRWGALLHDIGKIGVPDEILRKPGRLTEAEWKVMRQHPVIGEEILASTERMRGVAKIVRHHQEKWDGTGYPDGLRDEEIPLGARILAVVDAYSAITDDRPYKKARTHEDAIAELRRCAGAQFDPRVVEVFCRVVQRDRAKAARAP